MLLILVLGLVGLNLSLKLPKNKQTVPGLFQYKITESPRIKSITLDVDNPHLVPVFEEAYDQQPEYFSWYDSIEKEICPKENRQQPHFRVTPESVSIRNAFELMNAHLFIRSNNFSYFNNRYHFNPYLTRFSDPLTDSIKALHQMGYREHQYTVAALCLIIYDLYI